MMRETLERRASNIIEWKNCVPNLKTTNLSNFFASAVPELEEKALMKVYNAGFLSYSKNGNFSFSINLAPDFGFSLHNKKLYFTIKRNCRELLEDKDLFRYSKILEHGKYVIPEVIDKHDWAVIRVKHLFSQEEIMPKLTERGIISSEKKGNFSVAYKSSLHHRKVYLNLGKNSKYYFIHKKDAINFSKIFPMESEKLEIISH